MIQRATVPPPRPVRERTFDRYHLPFVPFRATLPATLLHEHAVYSPDLFAKCDLHATLQITPRDMRCDAMATRIC